MEIIDFLRQSEVTFESSAKQLSAMYAKYNASGDFEKSFKSVSVKREGEPMTAKQLLIFVKDKESDLAQIDHDIKSADDAVRTVILKVIESKQEFTVSKKAERVANVNQVDYVEKNRPVDIEIEIFQTVDRKPNEHDRKLYSCFCKAGEHIVFSSSDITKLILQNNDGSLALGNDMSSMSEGALYNSLCKAMMTEFQAYRALLKAELAAIGQDDLDMDKNATLVEDIFLNKVPCSFSKVLTVCKRYKDDGNGKGQKFFDGFIIKPNKRHINHFDFQDFISALAKNFIEMTRGCLKEQDEYKAFSNDPNEAAVTHWYPAQEATWKKAVMPPKWKDFFNGKASPHLLQRVFWYIGAMQDAHNYSQQALIISAPGMTGKSTLVELLYMLFPKDFFGPITNTTLDEKREFALSERRVWEHHCLLLDEYDGTAINGPRFKTIMGSRVPESMSVKNKQAINYNFKGTKMILLSNEMSVINSLQHRRRVIPVSFKKNCVSSRNRYTEDDKKELVGQGREFLDFCFRVYKESKFNLPNGDYYVLNPEQEEALLKGEDLGAEEDAISKKAFSDDEEISDYFDIRNYEERETNLDFNNFIDDKFEKTDDINDYMLAKDVLDYVESLANAKNSVDLNDMRRMLGPALRMSEGIWRVEHRDKIWWQFTQAMKEFGFKYKTKRIGNRIYKAWLGIKKKPNEYVAKLIQ